jgi:hypothetical protein
MSRGNRNFCFTVFAEPGEDLRLLDPSSWPVWVTYVIYQMELCPDTARHHFQGYLELEEQKRYQALQRELVGLETAHFEPRRGNQAQAIAYCRKEETRVDGPWEHGNPKAQGKRNDLLAAKAAIDSGSSAKRLAAEHFPVFIENHVGLQKYRLLTAPVRDWPMELIVLVGPTRTGKSRKAHGDFPNAYWKDSTKWWDGFDSHETVIWDEFYGHSCPFSTLLRLTDRYPMQVEIKGGYVQFNARRIVFTSNQKPKDWYSAEATHQGDWKQNPLRARLREFGRVVYLGEAHAVPQLPQPPAGVSPLLNLNPDFGQNEAQ